jgi:hypothetical protein
MGGIGKVSVYVDTAEEVHNRKLNKKRFWTDKKIISIQKF